MPVILFNYGHDRKRTFDLRIILAERDTGFCLWEFKFDRATQFKDKANSSTIFKLSVKHQYNRSLVHDEEHLVGDDLMHHQHHSHSQGKKKHHAIAYRNEYFERFFNGRKRHAITENLIKFVVKSDCDKFCHYLRGIMTDKRFEHYFDMVEQPFLDENQIDLSLREKFLIQMNKEIFDGCVNYFLMNADFPKYSSLVIGHNYRRPSLPNRDVSEELQENEKKSNKKSEFHSRHRLSKLKALDKASAVSAKKFHKSNISEPSNFNHVSHLDKPVPIGKRYFTNNN